MINNPLFADGNKRIGHAAFEVTLLMNDCEIQVDVEPQEDDLIITKESESQIHDRATTDTKFS